MSDKRHDIGDDEIRIIASSDANPRHHRRKKQRVMVFLLAAVVAMIAAAAIVLLTRHRGDDADQSQLEETVIENVRQPQPDDAHLPDDNVVATAAARGYTSRRDTTVNGTPLIILTPVNATARLVVGPDSLAGIPAILAAQAADIRKDNGEIVGTFVLDGRLISKGEAKAGYCSIVDGKISIGVADATPMLEEALQTDGYFFRQYPLVAAGLVVENRLKAKALRKALAEIDGNYCVVASGRALTLHDFSQALIDAGARNAIYLVGSTNETLYTDRDGNRHIIGTPTDSLPANANFIIWQ